MHKNFFHNRKKDAMMASGVDRMNDIPVFSTEYGVASLILQQIPYRQEAYIHLQATQQPNELLAECVSFCRVCGAERIYAAGHEILETYPLYCAVLEMRGPVRPDPGLTAHLFPVTAETVGNWRSLYNNKMCHVDNAVFLTAADENKILHSGGAYFVHSSGELLGIGWLEDEKVLAVAAVKPGAGVRVMHTLLDILDGETVTLEVASTNEKAIRLYESVGLLKTGERIKWYQVFNCVQ